MGIQISNIWKLIQNKLRRIGVPTWGDFQTSSRVETLIMMTLNRALRVCKFLTNNNTRLSNLFEFGPKVQFSNNTYTIIKSLDLRCHSKAGPDFRWTLKTGLFICSFLVSGIWIPTVTFFRLLSDFFSFIFFLKNQFAYPLIYSFWKTIIKWHKLLSAA